MNTMRSTDTVPVKLIRQIAVDAEADPRTVERLVVRGQPVRGRALVERIQDAARSHGVRVPAHRGRA